MIVKIQFKLLEEEQVLKNLQEQYCSRVWRGFGRIPKLKHLPKLTSFCEELDLGKFPELEIVMAEDIPNMKIFDKGKPRTPKLKQVYVTHITKSWKGDLNKTINYMHTNYGTLSKTHLIFIYMFRLNCKVICRCGYYAFKF